MKLIPMSLKDANAFVLSRHRHHRPVQGHKFSIGVTKDDGVCGVAIVGRPVSRHKDDGMTLEVTRLCTDGTRNTCSFLYGACARAAKSLGYRKIITYILEDELGTSLRASNWEMEDDDCGGEKWGSSYSGKKRESQDLFGIKYPHKKKQRWGLELN